ncbi:kinase-like domain-containing protein [Trametes elegans]|nr:kinase-like domain-containing protein [Trametes elegans]
MAPLRTERPRYSQLATPSGHGGFISTTRSKQPLVRTRLATHSNKTHSLSPQQQQRSMPTADRSSRLPPPLTLQDLEAISTIGEGGWGSVHIARVKRRMVHPLEQPGTCFAVKVIGKNVYRDLERNDRRRERHHVAERKHAERRTLVELPWHPFIAGIIGAFSDVKNTYLAMELGPCGTLWSEMKRWDHFTNKEVKFYFANIVLALEFLHTHGIVHCDIKPENLVLGADGYLMLVDFGLAQSMQGDAPWCYTGTLEYLSPEVAAKEPMESVEVRAAVDWWAAAVCLFELQTQQHVSTVQL